MTQCVVAKDSPVGRVYVKGRSGNSTIWTDDSAQALVLNSRLAGDKHINLYDLYGAMVVPVTVTDPSASEEPRTTPAIPIPWDGVHEIWQTSEAIILYIPRSDKAKRTGNHCINEDAMQYAKKLANEHQLNLRLFIEENRSERTYHDVDIDVVDELHLKNGEHGAYRLLRATWLS